MKIKCSHIVFAAAAPLLGLSMTTMPAAAGSSVLEGPVPAQLERVVDGDTVRVIAQVWLDQHISVSVRLAGVDAPELFRPKCAAEKAKARAAMDYVAELVGDGPLRLYDVERGKYAGRVIARIETHDGRDLSEALIDALHAAKGARGAWCSAG